MAHAHKREALKDLLSSAGWEYFREEVEAAFGAEATLQRLSQELILEDPGATRALIASRDAVLRMLSLPREMLLQIEEPEAHE